MKNVLKYFSLLLLIIAAGFILYGLCSFSAKLNLIGCGSALFSAVVLMLCNYLPDYVSVRLIRRDATGKILDVYLITKCTVEVGEMVSVECKNVEHTTITFPKEMIEMNECDFVKGKPAKIFEGFVEYHRDVDGGTYESHKIKMGM